MKLVETKNLRQELETVERISLHAQQEHLLNIRQGSVPSLAVTAPADLLPYVKTRVKDKTLLLQLGGSLRERLRDALRTSLTRSEIRYALVVKALTRLEVMAFARVRMAGLETDRLHILFKGAGLIEVEDLRAELLQIDFRGVGRIQVSGEVARQAVSVTGPGEYRAGKLLSRITRITVGSAGKATVWARDALDVFIRGIGCVDYYGYPQVQHHLSPMGRLVHAGRSPAEAYTRPGQTAWIGWKELF